MGIRWSQVCYGLIYLLNWYIFVPVYSGQGESTDEEHQTEFDPGRLKNEAGVLGFNCASALTQNAMYGVVSLVIPPVQLRTQSPSRPIALCLHARSVPGAPSRNWRCDLFSREPYTRTYGTYQLVLCSSMGVQYSCARFDNSRNVRGLDNECAAFCCRLSFHSDVNSDGVSSNRGRCSQ
jgi:hypothetical protein